MSTLIRILRSKLSLWRDRLSIDRQKHTDIASARGNFNEPFPSDFSATDKVDIGTVRPFTMTSPERLIALSRSIDYITEHQVEGDIVECGVWKGGSMMLIARKLMQLKDTKRKLYLFDTFEGMSAPGQEDVSSVDQAKAGELLDAANREEGTNVWCYSPLDEVKGNIKTTGYPEDKVNYIKGKVEDTIPGPPIEKIALLRLDTDWYESTRHELEHLYDKLVTGGILIIDDYGHWSGSKKAVDEFIEKRKLKIFLNRIDYTGRLAIKL